MDRGGEIREHNSHVRVSKLQLLKRLFGSMSLKWIKEDKRAPTLYLWRKKKKVIIFKLLYQGDLSKKKKKSQQSV